MRAQWSLKPGLCHHPSVCGQWRQRRWPPSRQHEIMPRPTGTACRRCPLDVGGRCGRFRRAARLSAWRHSRRNFVDVRRPCSTANLSAWLAVDGHSLRQEHVGRHLRGRGGVEGHVGGPEAKKWAMGILFYVLTRRLPALTLQIRGKWTCEVQLILETPNEI